MNKFMKQWKEDSSGDSQIHLLDLINTIVGVALIVSLVLIFQHPENRYAILAACLSGGLMNILNGLKQMKDVKRRMMGMTFLMMGTIVIILGFLIIQMV